MDLLEVGCESTAVEALDLEPSAAAEILDILSSANCLVHNAASRWVGTSLERQADYFSAMGADPDEVQSALANAKIAILGVGGIGSIALTHLVSAGACNFTLIDGDTVAPDNLNRQVIYRLSDVGRRKVDAATDWILERNALAVVHTVPRMLTDTAALATALEDVSVVVMAADSPSDIRLLAARACFAAGTASISADCGLRTASWGPLLEPAEHQAYADAMQSLGKPGALPRAQRPMRASFGPTNAIAASHLAKDLLNWLAGLSAPSRLAKVTLDMETMTAQVTTVAEMVEAPGA